METCFGRLTIFITAVRLIGHILPSHGGAPPWIKSPLRRFTPSWTSTRVTCDCLLPFVHPLLSQVFKKKGDWTCRTEPQINCCFHATSPLSILRSFIDLMPTVAVSIIWRPFWGHAMRLQESCPYEDTVHFSLKRPEGRRRMYNLNIKYRGRLALWCFTCLDQV